jgi:hypothetical protein
MDIKEYYLTNIQNDAQVFENLSKSEVQKITEERKLEESEICKRIMSRTNIVEYGNHTSPKELYESVRQLEDLYVSYDKYALFFIEKVGM